MKLSIYGIEKVLEIHQGELALLNIKNKKLYREIMNHFLYKISDKENNEIVITNDGVRLNSNDIEYIQDLMTYKFNNKMIVDTVLKSYLLSFDQQQKELEAEAYQKLIEPLLREMDLLEIDYNFNTELDKGFYSKIPNVSFEINNQLEPVEKIISILKVNIKLFRKKLLVINNANSIICKQEMIELQTFVRENSVYLLLIDHLDDSEVEIANNLCIGLDYGSYNLSMI